MPYIFVLPVKKEPTPTHLYVMGCRDAVKIGVAIDVERRRRTIQMSCPDEVTVLASVLMENFTEARAAEKQMHAMFADRRTFGEWFRMEPIGALNMLKTFRAYMHDAPAPLPVLPQTYPYDDPQMARMRIAARSLEF